MSKAVKPVKPGRAFGYGRASTEDQEATIVGQEAAILRAYETRYKDEGYAWGGLHMERGVSGAVPLVNRPEGHKLSVQLEQGDMVIVLKLDRAFRNAADCLSTFEVWRAKGVRLAIVDQQIDTGGPAGLAMLQMLAVFAQFERGMIGERMRQHWRTRRRHGGTICGRPPYGFKRIGPKGHKKMVPDQEVRAIGRRIVEWHDAGWGFFDIHRHLRDAGVVNPTSGRLLGMTTVFRWYHAERALRLREAAGK
jgi:DNA invertase Pin-like site-specific DNA recombinase